MTFHDLTMAGRNLGRRPGFAVTAILLLALGAGANAAVFSVVRGVLLRPLPYPQPDRLVALWPDAFVSNEEVDYWRRHTHAFDEIAAQAPGWLMALTATTGEPLKVTGAKTSDNLFKTLGAGAALMLRSLWNLQQVDPGFHAEELLTFRLQTTSKYRSLTTGLPYLNRMVERVSSLPGVRAVGAIGHPPLGGYSWSIGVRREDQPLTPGTAAPQVGWRFVGWSYFEAMGIPLAHGRPFDTGDRGETRAVGIVNTTFARKFFGEAAKALGQTIVQYGGGKPGEQVVEIVGVSADTRHLGLDKPPVPELFRPIAQTFMFPMAFVVRTSGAPASLAAAVRQTAFDVDPAIPVAELQPYTTIVADTLGRPRLLGFLLSVFAAAGLVLGLVGVYGVAAYRVRQHEREIGIRLALGAAPTRVASRVLRQGLFQATAGLALGIPVALALTRAMESVIFGVTPHDPVTFVALPLVILGVSAAATYLPARRAARVDPLVAMREE